MKRIIVVFAIVFAFLDFTQSTEEISSLAYGKKLHKRYHHKKNDYSQMKKSNDNAYDKNDGYSYDKKDGIVKSKIYGYINKRGILK